IGTTRTCAEREVVDSTKRLRIFSSKLTKLHQQSKAFVPLLPFWSTLKQPERVHFLVNRIDLRVFAQSCVESLKFHQRLFLKLDIVINASSGIKIVDVDSWSCCSNTV